MLVSPVMADGLRVRLYAAGRSTGPQRSEAAPSSRSQPEHLGHWWFSHVMMKLSVTSSGVPFHGAGAASPVFGSMRLWVVTTAEEVKPLSASPGDIDHVSVGRPPARLYPRIRSGSLLPFRS